MRVGSPPRRDEDVARDALAVEPLILDFFGERPERFPPESPEPELLLPKDSAEPSELDPALVGDTFVPAGRKVGNESLLMTGCGLCEERINTSSKGLVDFLGRETTAGVDSALWGISLWNSSCDTYSNVGSSGSGSGGVVLGRGFMTSTCSTKPTARLLPFLSSKGPGASSGAASMDGR